MKKEDSSIMKGVAILLMLYGHLFFQKVDLNLCTCFIHFGGISLVELLTRASNPVAFFLILSGYGLYTVETSKKDYNILYKIKSLYVHYWISLIIFVPLGACLVGIGKYPGTIKDIIENVTAWHTTWNGEIWFFFPYVLLALSSKFLFKLMDKVNIWLFMGVTLFLSFYAAFCISRYGDAYLYHHQLPYMPILYFDLIFAFTAGAWMAKYNIVEKFNVKVDSLRINRNWLWLLLVLLISFRCCFRTGAFHSFYTIAFIILFVNAPRWKCVNDFLTFMGRRSTSIWLVHTYFCYYLFHDFIYDFKYPIVIFLVLLACSYISAVIIDYINARIQILINK